MTNLTFKVKVKVTSFKLVQKLVQNGQFKSSKLIFFNFKGQFELEGQGLKVTASANLRIRCSMRLNRHTLQKKILILGCKIAGYYTEFFFLINGIECHTSRYT